MTGALYSSVCVGPGRKPHFWFSYEATQMVSVKDIEDIQVFGVNMSFISLSEVKIFYIS